MKPAILKAGLLAAALLAAGAAQAQPFNFITGTPDSTAAPSPAPFNFLNGPEAAPPPIAAPPRMERRHARYGRHRDDMAPMEEGGR